MSQTLSLYRLQQTDSNINRTQTRIKAIQSLMEEDEALRSAVAQVEVAERNRLAAERKIREAENNVADLNTKIEQNEASLYGGKIKNPKELQDLQQEAESLKKHLSTLEERLLEEMINHEETVSNEERSNEELKQTQEHVSNEHKVLAEEMSTLNKEIEKLMAERQAIVGTIQADYLDLYTELFQQKRGIAVAGVSDNACEICGTTLTPAQNQAAQSTNQITFCPTCRRIIYSS